MTKPKECMPADASPINCSICGASVMQASERGAYLKNLFPGWACAPSCNSAGSQEDAILRALEGQDQ